MRHALGQIQTLLLPMRHASCSWTDSTSDILLPMRHALGQIQTLPMRHALPLPILLPMRHALGQIQTLVGVSFQQLGNEAFLDGENVEKSLFSSHAGA